MITGVIKIIRWIFSIFFLIAAFLFLKLHFVSFVILFSLSLLLIPEIWKFVQSVIGKEIPGKFYALFLFILFLFAVSISPSLPSEKTKEMISSSLKSPIAISPTMSYQPSPTTSEEKPFTTRLPEYELVRENEDNGAYSAVIYSAEIDDYLIPNLISDFKKRKNKDKLTVMIFSKEDKPVVEKAFDADDDSALNTISDKIRAEYRKDIGEELYYYPDGLKGEKLVLEVI